MIKELRLGNLILMNGEQSPVYQLEHRFKETYRLNDITIDARIIGDRFQGIELTPEWLIKLGFDERCSWFHFDVHDDLGLRYEPVENLLVIYDNDESSIQLKNIKHVHQIQNLFWCLTGKELELRH